MNAWYTAAIAITAFGFGGTVAFIYEGCRRGGSLDLVARLNRLETENDTLARGYIRRVEQTNVVPFHRRSVTPDSPPKAGDPA